MAAPTVSVVIPCYRQAHFLSDALDSLSAQRGVRCEVVVVDDGSPDDVAGVVSGYADVHCLRQDNAGLAAARNAGFAATTAPYVAFLDADDRLLRTALVTGLHTLEAELDAPFAWGFNRPIDEDGRVTGGISNPWPHERATYFDLLRRNVVGPPAGVLFRRSALERVGGFSSEPASAEDYEMYLRLARHQAGVCHGEVVAEYRLHDENMSADLSTMLSGVLWALERQRPHVSGDPSLERALEAGIRDAWVVFDGERRRASVGAALGEGLWLRALREGAALAVRYPSIFTASIRARLGRRRILDG